MSAYPPINQTQATVQTGQVNAANKVAAVAHLSAHTAHHTAALNHLGFILLIVLWPSERGAARKSLNHILSRLDLK